MKGISQGKPTLCERCGRHKPAERIRLKNTATGKTKRFWLCIWCLKGFSPKTVEKVTV